MASRFVLIPGAWHTASSWLPVAHRLRAAGRTVDLVELPGQRPTVDESPGAVRLADAVAALVDHVQADDAGELTLVGHSLGGYVIGGALASIADRVERVIYYNAHIPVPGRSMSEAFPERMAPLRAEAEAQGCVAVPPFELIRDAFVPGASEDLQRLIEDLLVPTPGAYFLDALDHPSRPADYGIASAFVLGEDDLILPPPAAQFPAMLGLAPIMVPGGHESLFTHPGPLAEALLAR